MKAQTLNLETTENEKSNRDENRVRRATGHVDLRLMPKTASKKPSIEHWIEQAVNGNAEAFRPIYDAYFDRVVNHVGRLVGVSGEIEDVTQEIFVQIFRSITTFKFECKFSTWVYRLSYNVAVSHLRKKPHLVELAAYRPLAEGSNSWAELEARDLVRVLEAALKQVPVERREAFLLHEVDGYKLREIAELTGDSINTVSARVRRTREQMQHILEANMRIEKEQP